ncbi:hypothetical protein FMM05_07105 [Flavobacterium zepuense]|uniref:Uncharacterized protein n=1 Tax=Flavobacterium zepuense TaxID=2593302 RepID=A0A552V681_9FLAO|nr:hypothetical protein [Flavobacterium zepuense]TRW25983.1 hypothetical protein FMM05_07105 [Flavobacterium zepuense]
MNLSQLNPFRKLRSLLAGLRLKPTPGSSKTTEKSIQEQEKKIEQLKRSLAKVRSDYRELKIEYGKLSYRYTEEKKHRAESNLNMLDRILAAQQENKKLNTACRQLKDENERLLHKLRKGGLD